MSPESTATPGFESEIKELFRERDRRAMLSRFDLWSYDDVSSRADAILEAVRTGAMPCDGAWPGERVERFSSWVDGGKPR
jgi:hypothetical protein